MNKQIDQLQIELANELVRLRKESSVLSEFQIAKELGMGYDSLYKIEKGITVPTNRTLQTLYTAYKMTPKEYARVKELRIKIVELKKKEKSV